MTQEKEAFLDRWSRLKQEQPARGADTPAVPEAKEDPAPPLPPVEQLKPESDFTPFMNPEVNLETRRSALKKLFADAHYNIPDAYEPYSADFTQGEPIPEQMLRAINRARDLAVKGPEKVAEEERLAAEQARAEADAKAATAQDEAQNRKPDDVAGRQDA
jgi:hypothetical protein